MNVDFSKAFASVQAMVDGFIARLPAIALAFIVFVLIALVAKHLRTLVERVSLRHRRHRHVGIALGRLVQGVTVLFGLLVALVVAIPTFHPGELVQLLGIGSVAIGFAFRDILQNFLAGILLLLTEPFRIGDQIRVGEFEGMVEEIQTRATLIRTADGRRVVIPNGTLFTQSVTVNTAFAVRRFEHEVTVKTVDAETSRQCLKEAVERARGVLATPPPEVFVIDATEDSAKVRVRWWVNGDEPSDGLASQDAVVAAVQRAQVGNGARARAGER